MSDESAADSETSQRPVSTITPECGCSNVPESDVVPVPTVGRECYGCHTPFRLTRWDDIIDTYRVAHHTGEVTHHECRLVGLDAAGRAVYDSFDRVLLTVVPKHHMAFRDNIPDDAPIWRSRADHGPGTPLNAPDGDVLTIVCRTPLDGSPVSLVPLAEHLCEVVPGRSCRTRWDALSDYALNTLEKASNSPSLSEHSRTACRALARLYGGNNRPFQRPFPK